MEGSALALRGVGPPSTHPILVHIPLITPQPPSAASPERKCCKFCLQWYFQCELFVFYSGSKFCPGWGYRTWYLPCIRSFNKSKLPRITPQGKVPQAAQTEGFLLVVLAGGLGRAGSSLQAVLQPRVSAAGADTFSSLSFKGPCHVQELLWCLQWLYFLPITALRVPNALLLAVRTHPQLPGFGSFPRWTPGDEHQWEEVAGDFQGWFPPYHCIALYFGGRVKIL